VRILGDGAVRLTRKNEIGKFISSLIQWSKHSIKHPAYHPENSISLIVQEHRLMYQESFYPYISLHNRKNIADFLQVNFDINIELFFIKGYRHGFKQKDIINAFLHYYNLPWSITNFEMIKQRDFRKRKNVKRILADFLVKI
jgi:hypothetical protein